METTRSDSDRRLSAALRGRTFIAAVIVVLILLSGNLLGAGLVFVWAALSKTPLQALGFRRPTTLIGTFVGATVGGVSLKLAMKALVMPLLGFGATNDRFAYLIGNRQALVEMLLFVVVGGGFGEETIWRGFLFERLNCLMRPAKWGGAILLAISTILFALAHYADQGVAGVTQAAVTGLVFGSVFIIRGEIWSPMVVHAAFDVTAVLLIYWNLEALVAHAIFR